MLFKHITYEHLNFIKVSLSVQSSELWLTTVGRAYSQAAANTEEISLYKDLLEYLITEHISLPNNIWHFVLWVEFVAIDYNSVVTLKVTLVELAWTFCKEPTYPLRMQQVSRFKCTAYRTAALPKESIAQ